jgi:cation diffusion facilitator CzcD-associated flavoprotein CzcO
MEINIWTSTNVLSASQDPKTKIWAVKVKKADGTDRVFHVNHVVLATGFRGGKGYVPTYPGMVGVFLYREALFGLMI